MKLQYKFGLGIIVISCILSIGIANMCVQWVNTYTIRDAENRVGVYIKAAWAIHDCKISRIRSVLEILTQEQEIIDLPANAIKYGREGGTILLDVHEDKDVLKIKMEEKR